MKISLTRSHFLKSLNHAKKIIEKNSTVPILSNVLIDATGQDHITVTATDLEVSLVQQVPAAIEQPGKTTVSCRKLHEIVNNLPGEAEIFLSLNAEQTRLIIESGKSHFELAVLNAEDYPAVQITDLPCRFMLARATLAEMISRTAFAMSTEETRYFLNGIYIHATPQGELRAVATDGHRMARMQTALPQGAENMPGVIVSRKTITLMQDILSDSEGTIALGLSDTQISTQFDQAYLISRLVDGNFPDYERVIPQGANKKIAFEASALARVIQRVSTMSSEKTHGIKLSIQQDKIKFSADGSDFGTADEEMEIQYSGDPVTIGFNSKYLLDVANDLERAQKAHNTNDEAHMYFSDETAPVVIQTPNDATALYVLMPMRI
jgi:DNA polymerase-3 subunit beta